MVYHRIAQWLSFGTTPTVSLHDTACSRSSTCCRLVVISGVNTVTFSAKGGFGDDALDVAVFRFTLGIPGFDDDLIPRVVGALGAALLAGNHVLAGSPPSNAQVSQLPAPALLVSSTPWLCCGAHGVSRCAIRKTEASCASC